MENRKGDKIIEIEKYLKELESFLPSDFNKYINNIEKKAACERYFEKIVEAVIDLVFLVIKDREFRSPISDRDALNILSENGIMSLELSDKLGDAKSMRNIIIHEYGYIDDKLVFCSMKKELFCDVEKFLEAIR